MTDRGRKDLNKGENQKNAPPWRWPGAAYVHIPFCAHHCSYCDFAIATGRDDLREDYLTALENELRTLGKPCPVKTWFLGGGTPTQLSPAQLERLISMLREWLPLLPGGEFSIEANPDDCDLDRLRVLFQGGLTRLSLGVQSFHQPVLQFLDRRHDPAQVRRAIDNARKLGLKNLSLDLIFGSAGMTLDMWKSDLQTALDFKPAHISTYNLTYEKGTPLWKKMNRGDLIPLGESEELHQYELAMDLLEEKGFEHYEISSFARPGWRCVHNQVYWANHAYWGFGMGAAKYVAGVRSVNSRDLAAYIRKATLGEDAAFQSEQLESREEARETLGLNMRRMEGALRPEFLQRTGYDLDQIAGLEKNKLVEQGLLLDDGQRLRLSRKGRPLADWVITRLFADAQ